MIPRTDSDSYGTVVAMVGTADQKTIGVLPESELGWKLPGNVLCPGEGGQQLSLSKPLE